MDLEEGLRSGTQLPAAEDNVQAESQGKSPSQNGLPAWKDDEACSAIVTHWLELAAEVLAHDQRASGRES